MIKLPRDVKKGEIKFVSLPRKEGFHIEIRVLLILAVWTNLTSYSTTWRKRYYFAHENITISKWFMHSWCKYTLRYKYSNIRRAREWKIQEKNQRDRSFVFYSVSRILYRLCSEYRARFSPLFFPSRTKIFSEIFQKFHEQGFFL